MAEEFPLHIKSNVIEVKVAHSSRLYRSASLRFVGGGGGNEEGTTTRLGEWVM